MSSRFRIGRRRGIAMLLVLGIVVFFTMLGFMGLQFASRDSGVAGSVLDIRSRDVATRSGISLALQSMASNPSNTATQLGAFVADSSAGSPKQWMNFANVPFTLQAADPGWFSIGDAMDESAVKVRVVSMDIGDATGAPSDGVRVTLECTAKGRNANPITVLASYRMMGMQVPVTKAASSTNDYALYLNGSLANSNMGTSVTGNVYISGNTSLNGSATFTVKGKLRVNGDFNTNAPITVDSNAVIGGNIYTNSSGPMTFQKSVVVKGAVTTMNGALSVAQNLEVQGGGAGGSWNNTGTLSVGGQLWFKTECREINAGVTVVGNAFYDGCLRHNVNAAHSYGNLYVGRSGGVADDYILSGSTTVVGNMGDWHVGGGWEKFRTDGNSLVVNGMALWKAPVHQINSGSIWVKGNAQFWSGVGGIAQANGIRVDGTTFIQSSDQHGKFNGGMSLGNNLTMKGNINSDFGENAGNSRWAFQTGAASKVWKYDGTPCISTGADPRVTNATTTNASGGGTGGCNTGTATPSDLFSAPTPVASTAYATPFTARDLDLSSSQTWNQVQTADYSKISGAVDLTSDSLTAAGSHTDNLTASDINKIYQRFKKSNGWAVVRIHSTSSIGSISTPGGKFSGKMLWIIEKSVNVNGNWPGSNTTSDLQVLWIRTGGTLGNFGSPADFSGYIRFDPSFSGQMSWGTSTFRGAIHFVGGGSSVTGNGCANLTIVNTQSVFDAISSAFPGLLADPSGTAGSGAASSTRTLAARQSALQFIPEGEYR